MRALGKILAFLRAVFQMLLKPAPLMFGLVLLFILINNVVQHNRFFNLTAFETTKSGGASSFFTSCFKGYDKIIYPWQYQEFFYINTVKVVSSDVAKMNITASSGIIFGSVLAANIARLAIYKALFASGAGAVVAIAALAVEYGVMSEACSRLYVVAPHDYLNRQNNAICSQINGVYDWDVSKSPNGVVTASKVPYFYSCNCSTFLDSEPNEANWGCRNFAGDDACTGGNAKYAVPDKVGKIVVEYYPAANSYSAPCNSNNRGQATLSPGQIGYVSGSGVDKLFPLYAFYSDSGRGGRELCAAAPYTLLPIRIGCTPVPPPLESEIDNATLPKNNRCAYFNNGSRPDLAALAASLNATDGQGRSSNAVKKFLAGDFHLTSTMLGCVQDLFYQTLMNPTSGSNTPGFFQVIQERMHDIVFAVLILYVSLVGISIMSNPNGPKASELIMHLVKFALVLFFALGDGWYQEVNGGSVGLYQTLINAPNELANLFLQAQANNDPANRCGYMYSDGQELLGEREIAATSGSSATYGWGDKVRLSTWDLVDCKIISYMNLGTCNFKFTDIISTLGMLLISSSWLIALFCLFYTFVLLLLILRLACLGVLITAIISLMVFISPIVLCFSLFAYTKETFNSWFRNLLSFMFFPALLFAYLAFMFTVFDVILYGPEYVTAAQSYSVSSGANLSTVCPSGNDSLYCLVATYAKADPCAGQGALLGALLEPKENGKYKTRAGVSNKIQAALLKLLLFSFLFYMLMDSVTQFMPFILGIRGNVMQQARGSMNIVNMGASAAGSSTQTASRAAGNVKRIASRI